SVGSDGGGYDRQNSSSEPERRQGFLQEDDAGYHRCVAVAGERAARGERRSDTIGSAVGRSVAGRSVAGRVVAGRVVAGRVVAGGVVAGGSVAGGFVVLGRDDVGAARRRRYPACVGSSRADGVDTVGEHVGSGVDAAVGSGTEGGGGGE